MAYHPTTSRVHEVVHTLRQKPEQVRQNIALGVAGGITLVVAIGWFAAISTSGVLTLAPTPADTNKQVPPPPDFSTTKDGINRLLGAAGAAMGATSSVNTVTVVDTKSSSTFDSGSQNGTNETVIHF